MLKPVSVSLAITLAAAASAAAQTKTVAGEMITVTSTVEAIEQQSRTLTLKKQDGTYTTLVVPDSYVRFPAIKVGDTVTARYYDNIVFRKLNPGEKAVNSVGAGTVPTPGSRPGGTASVQRTVTTTITAIDNKIPSITFSGPNNWVYSSKVNDKAALASVKVGDQVNITWTEAVSIEVTAPKK